VFAGVVVGLLPVVEVPVEPEVELEEVEEEEAAAEVAEVATPVLVEVATPEVVVVPEEALEVELEPEPAGGVDGTGAFAQPFSIFCDPAAVRVRPSVKPVVAPCCVQTNGRIEANLATCVTKKLVGGQVGINGTQFAAKTMQTWSKFNWCSVKLLQGLQLI